MKLSRKDKLLLELIDFITDRFFGRRVQPHMLVSAIQDFNRKRVEK